MKIRMKHDHREIVDAIELHQTQRPEHSLYGRWVSGDPVSGTTTYYNEKVWEKVPDERWEPVRCMISLNDHCQLRYEYTIGTPELRVGYLGLDSPLLRFVKLGEWFRIEERVS